MRTSWKLFISAILLILGFELNLWEKIFLITFPEPIQCILFGILLVVIFVAIRSSDELMMDLGTMSMLTIGMYYFGGMVPFEELLGHVAPIILGIISLAMIIIGVIILVCVVIFDFLSLGKKEEVKPVTVSASNPVKKDSPDSAYKAGEKPKEADTKGNVNGKPMDK